MAGKALVLITGANQGLGYYAAQQLSATGKHHILLGSRDISKAEQAISTLEDDKSIKANRKNVEPLQIDVLSDESIEQAAATVEKKYGYLDILMVNSGISNTPGTLREQYKKIYDTNVFGAAVTTEAFIPLVRKSTVPGGKRIAFTSSGLASLALAHSAGPEDPLNPKNWLVYRSTKTALSMVMLYYARLLQEDGFVVTGSDPGYCATNLNAYNGFKDPREGAKVLIRAAVEEKEKVHARVIDENGPEEW